MVRFGGKQADEKITERAKLIRDWGDAIGRILQLKRGLPIGYHNRIDAAVSELSDIATHAVDEMRDIDKCDACNQDHFLLSRMVRKRIMNGPKTNR